MAMSKAEAGRLGGIASVKKATKEQRVERAMKGGISTIQKYGSAFYGHISRMYFASRRDKR